MALTGLQIQKLLPKTNCKECGSSTCLAFAMKLAAKKAELSQCPYASEEAKQVLGAAAEPPVKALALGGKGEVKVGGETVLYRHEKTFVNPTALAVAVRDIDPPAERLAVLGAIKKYRLDRVGQTFGLDMVAVVQKGPDAKAFASLAKEVLAVAGKPLILFSPERGALASAAAALKGSGSVLAPESPGDAEALWPVAKENGLAMAVTAPDLNALVSLTSSLKEQGFNNLLLRFQTSSLAEQFQTNSLARRAALKSEVKALGYPSLRFIEKSGYLAETAEAINEIAKYGGVCVLPSFDPAQIAALLTLRLNLYTDPQKPIQVEPKVYAVGDPKPDSPVFLTTNFSLTYFIVSGEIENSGTSAWLVVPECEGMSVLTAWAAGKFSGAIIAKFIHEIGLEKMATTRQIVIPGYVSQISGELEEKLPGWKVLVGPQEAADIESFVKNRLGKQ